MLGIGRGLHIDVAAVQRTDHLLDRQGVLGREFMVAFVVAGHRHHRAGAVTHQHEVRDPDRYTFTADRVRCVDAGGDAALFLGFQSGFCGRAVAAFLDEGGQFQIRLGRLDRQRMFGGDRDEGHAHQGVGARGVDAQWRRLALGRSRHPASRDTSASLHVDREVDLQSFRAPDPVALHGLDRFRPARQAIEFVQQFLGVGGDLEEPLRDLAAFDHGAGAPAAAVDDLLVGEHGFIHRVPVHDRVAAVDKPALEQPREEQLFPAVVVRAAGREFAGPVDRVPERLQLPAHVLDVGVRPLRRRGVVLDRGVFRRQAERVPAHRLQHVLAVHALEAADHVADRVVAHVAHVQGTRRVRQHRQHVVLGFAAVFRDLVGAGTRPIRLGGGFDRFRVVVFVHARVAPQGRIAQRG